MEKDEDFELIQLAESLYKQPENITKSVEIFLNLANKGNKHALYKLGNHYFHILKDYEKAFECYEKLAKLNSDIAQYILAYNYIKGSFCKKDVQKGLNLLELSANQGNLDAIFELG